MTEWPIPCAEVAGRAAAGARMQSVSAPVASEVPEKASVAILVSSYAGPHASYGGRWSSDGGRWSSDGAGIASYGSGISSDGARTRVYSALIASYNGQVRLRVGAAAVWGG